MDKKFSYEFLTLSKPYYILLIIPNLIAIMLEKNQTLKFILSFSLGAFSAYKLTESLAYLDIWTILLISFILFLYSFFSKEKFNIQGNLLIGDLEKFIYEKDFKNYLTAKEFNFLFSSAKPNRLRENNSNLICNQSQNFDKVFYFAIIPLSAPIDIKKNEILISYLKESSWFGIVELSRVLEEFLHPNYLNKKEKHEDQFGLELNLQMEDLESKNNARKHQYLYSLSVKNKNYDIVYYEWNKDVFLNLIKYSSNYAFVNKLLFMWLKYLSGVNSKLEEHSIIIKRAVERNDSAALEEIHPMIRYEKAVENKLKRGRIDYFNEYEDLKYPLLTNPE